MRDVNVVKEKRDVLRKELEEFNAARRNIYLQEVKHGKNHNKNLLGYIISASEKLMVQINAIEYVLNEDTLLNDVSLPQRYHDKFGIKRSDVDKYLE